MVAGATRSKITRSYFPSRTPLPYFASSPIAVGGSHVVSAIASLEGLEHAKLHLPAGTRFWIGAIDEEMTAQAYIVPGLGDAGDLAYGRKA